MTKQIIADNLVAYLAANTPSWGSREYPLYTQDAANACPSARYVGGVSRWLCECINPEECGGVLAAAQLATPADPENESMGLNVARLGVRTVSFGGSVFWAYRGMRAARPAASAIVDSIPNTVFSIFGIKAGVPTHCGRWHVRVSAKVESGAPHHWETEINGSPATIRAHFLGQEFNIGVVDDLICRPYRVEFLAVL